MRRELEDGKDIKEIEKTLRKQGFTIKELNYLWKIYDEIKNEKSL